MGCTIKDEMQAACQVFARRGQTRDSEVCKCNIRAAVPRIRKEPKAKFSVGLGILALAVIESIVLGNRVDTTYDGWDGAPVSEHATNNRDYTWDSYLSTGEYLDRIWYSVLDEEQYDYLDREQYNLMGGRSYVLGHPAYPKLYEMPVGGGVGFSGGGFRGFFGFSERFETGNERRWSLGETSVLLGGAPVGGYAVAFRSFSAGDYIDKWWYYYLDKGQYHYLDVTQYVLLGGLGYLYGRFSYGPAYGPWTHGWREASERKFESPSAERIPEPSTISFWALGYLCFSKFGRSPKR